MEEIWKAWDDRYFVSNLGRVKSFYAHKTRILKPFKSHDGYLMIDIRHPGYRKSISVHRMVAILFIPNPYNLPEVNHKDENKENNCVDNLEWCTTQYNCNYGTRNTRKGIHCQKPVYSVDDEGNIKYYKSVKSAGEETGISKETISKVLNHTKHYFTAGGLHWFYDNKG